jgi:hypothetical protein
MADANTPSEGSFVFDSIRLDIVVGDEHRSIWTSLALLTRPLWRFASAKMAPQMKTDWENTNECA